MSEVKHVVCTACGAINRISTGRNASAGKCGKCGVAPFTGEPAGMSATRLERQIAKSDIPVLVDIWPPGTALVGS